MKSIYAIALATVLGSTYAFSSPGDDGCIGNCPQGGGGGGTQTQTSDNSNTNKNTNNNTAQGGSGTGVGIGVGVGKGGAGGDGGDALAVGVNKNENTSQSQSAANSSSNNRVKVNNDSHSDSSAYSGDVRSDVAVDIEGPRNRNDVVAQGGDGGRSKSNATGGAGGSASNSTKIGPSTSTSTGGSVGDLSTGASTATVGNTTAHGGTSGSYVGDTMSNSTSKVGDTTSKVGNTTAQVGDTIASNGGNTTGDNTNDITVEGDTYEDNSSYSYINEEAAASAASVYANVCQNAGSAQTQQGGFAVVNQDVICEHLKLAAVMREAYVWEMNHGQASCSEPTTMSKDNGMLVEVCMSDAAMTYYKAYHNHLNKALVTMDQTEEVGTMDKFFGALIRPLGVIGALVWLL